MLEHTEDKSDEGPSSSVGERSPAANKTGTADRLVYKLVKVGDDGSVLPATEDEVFQSLVEGSSAGPSFTGGSDANEDYEDEEERSDGSLDDSDDDDSDGKEDPSFPSELEDLVAERKKLLAQFEVVDTMLLRVDAEQQKRLSSEDQVGSVLGQESNSSVYINAGDAIGFYKRQRRPNPRYFDFDAKGDPVPPTVTPLMTLKSSNGEPAATGTLPEKLPLPPSGLVAIPRNMSGRGSQQSSMRTAGTHRARTVVNQKPSTRTSTKVQAPRSAGVRMVDRMPHPASLENLSIRELHEAFRSTYGRDTSVKDKHWLKRQISTGWRKHCDAAGSIASSHSQLPSQADVKVRPEQQLSAERSLPSSTAATEMATERDTVNDVQELGTDAVDLTEGLSTNGVEDSKQSLHRALPLAVISPEEGLDASAPGGVQIALYGEVVNTGKQVGGKRQRKPNRRYIEDEEEASPCTVIANCSALAGPVGSDSGGHGLGRSTRLSWRTVVTDGPPDLIGQRGTLQGSTLQNSSRANILQGQCTKSSNGSLAWCTQKRKAEGRATKLVKMAHSATTAAAAQHDTEGTIRKVKFQLPAAPGRYKDGLYELNGEARDQVACFLPVSSGDSADLLQPPLVSDNGADPAGEQLVATVPTANGGTRRKHHRPWTLREVMTLVEGVACCGGGKWADIKKLAFSSVGHRTAVDLKDKWRNLLRASRVQQHLPKQGERKKQFTAAIPATLLAQVRELAAIPHQEAPGTDASGSESRSPRTVHRK